MKRRDQQLLDLLARSPFGEAGEVATQQLAPLFLPQRIDKGEVVFLEGEAGGRLFLIGEGRLKAFRTLPGGRSITVFILTAGDYFGFIPLLDGGPFPLSVSALAPSVVYALTRADLVRVVRENADLGLSLLGYMAHRLRGCVDQVGQLGRQGAANRAANALLGLLPAPDRRTGSEEVVLPFSQVELARTLDVSPENLSRALARLCREGVIRRTGPRRFHIVDVATLRRMGDTG